MRKIRGVKLRDFRGYLGLREIDVDADLVLLVGKNGVGKTSLFQAMSLVLNGYDVSIFKDLNLKYLKSSAKDSEIVLLGAGDETLGKSASNKEWESWRSQNSSVVSGLNPSVLRAATAFFQESIKELADGDFLSYLSGANNRGLSFINWAKGSQEKWRTLADRSIIAEKNWDDERKNLFLAIRENVRKLDGDTSKVFVDFSPLTLKSDNLSSTWQGQFATLAKRLGVTVPGTYGVETCETIANAVQEYSRKLKVEFEVRRSKQLEGTNSRQKLIQFLTEFRGDLQFVSKSSWKKQEEQVVDIESRIRDLKKSLELIADQIPKTEAIEEMLHAVGERIQGAKEEVLRIKESATTFPDEVVDFIMGVSNLYRSETEAKYAEWMNFIRKEREDLLLKIQTENLGLSTLKNDLEFSKLAMDAEIPDSVFGAEARTDSRLLLTKFNTESIGMVSTEYNSLSEGLVALSTIAEMFSRLLNLEIEFRRGEEEKGKQPGFNDAKKYAASWSEVFRKEGGTSGQFSKLLNDIDLSPLELEAKGLLELFHLPLGFVENLRISQKGVGKGAALVPSLDDVLFNDLSTGQKTLFAFVWTVILNRSLHKKIGHDVLMFDDFTTSLDLNQIGPACIVLRKLAYAKDLGNRRQVFISSHHEDLTNHLIDHLIPPDGLRMKVMEFKDYDPKIGPIFETWNVEAGGKLPEFKEN